MKTLHRRIDFLDRLSELVDDRELNSRDMLRKALRLLTACFSSPDDIHARVSFDGREIATDGFRQGSRRLDSDIRIDGDTRGALQVHLDDSAENGFSAGEETLISTAARLLGQGLQRRLTRKKLRASEEHLSVILQSIGDGVIATDAEGRITRMNRSAEQLTGWPGREAEGRPLESVLHIESADNGGSTVDPLHRFLESNGTADRPKTGVVVARDGTRRRIEASSSPIESGEDSAWGSVIVLSDETDRYRAAERLREAEQYRQSIFELIPDIKVLQAFAETSDHSILRFSREGIYLDVITSSEDRLYLPKDELVGRNVVEILPEREGSAFVNAIAASLDTGQLQTIEYTLSTPEKDLWFEARILPASDDEVLALVRDITGRKELEQQMQHLSFHDELTGLHNRAYAQQQMEATVAEQRLPLGIIMADLNGLKFINDSFGHAWGDRVLQAAAETISKSCRGEDLVARWGGDEFVVFLPDTTQEDAVKILLRIEKAAGALQIGELGLPLSMALGWATRTSEYQDIGAVIGEAENRMYRDKLSRGSSQDGILSGLMNTLQAKSHETQQHVKRMQSKAVRLAKSLGLESSELERLKMLIALHDIGKINVPEDTLSKPGPLTENGWELVRSHPEIGYRIARRTRDFSRVAEDILHHHERWDGCGYPDGLKGEDIPLLSRITAIVDAYDVMTNERPYSGAVGRQEAISELRRCAGTQFDPQLVEIFVDILRSEDQSNTASRS